MNNTKDINNEVRTLAKGTIFSVVGRVFGRALNVLTQVVIARTFGPAAYGLYAIGWAILRIVGVISTFGFDRTVIIYGVKYWKQDSRKLKRLIIISIFSTLMFSLTFTTFVVFYSESIAALLFKDIGKSIVIKIFALIIPLQSLILIGGGVTRITEDMKYAIVSEEVIQPASNIILIGLVVMYGGGFVRILQSTLVSFVLSSFFIVVCILLLFSDAFALKISDEPTLRFLIKSSGYLAIPGVLSAIVFWSDRFVLGAISSVNEVGIFQAVSQFSALFSLILASVNSIFSPMIANLYHKNEKGNLNELYKISTKWMLYIALLASVVTFVAPELVLSVLFGKEYAVGAFALRVMTIGQLVNVATGSVGLLLIMTNRSKIWSLSILVALPVSIGLNLYLSPHLGALGTAISTTIAIIIMYGLGLYQVNRHLGIWPYDSRYIKGIASAIVSAIFAIGFINFFFFNPIVELTMLFVVVVVAFVVSMVLMGFDREDFWLYQMFLNKKFLPNNIL